MDDCPASSSGQPMGGQGRELALKVEEDSPVNGKLKRGNVLAGVVENKKLQRIETPRSFYEALYQLRPGTEVSVRRGDPDGADDIAFKVGQGIDERKPLFSLFVIGAARVADCEWIGWSPVGPYDTSSPKAEKYLGWHFNTGDPKAPCASPTPANIASCIIARTFGRTHSARRPRIAFDTETAAPGCRRVGGRRGAVATPGRASVVGCTSLPHPAPGGFARTAPLLPFMLAWSLDDGPETPLNLDQPGEASFQLPVTLKLGEHRVIVTAKTLEAAPQSTVKSLILSYQPPAPEIVYKDAGQQIAVPKPDFTLETNLKSTAEGENVRVTIYHRHDQGQEKPHTQTFTAKDLAAGTVPLNHKLKLRPGNNEVEVVAVNGAPSASRNRKRSV